MWPSSSSSQALQRSSKRPRTCTASRPLCQGSSSSSNSGSGKWQPPPPSRAGTPTKATATVPPARAASSSSSSSSSSPATTTAAADSGPLNRRPVIATTMDAETYAYLLAHTREPPPLARLRAATEGMRGAHMQVSPDQGALLALLAELIGARRCLEVGVFTGYSALAVALALARGEAREEQEGGATTTRGDTNGGDDDSDPNNNNNNLDPNRRRRVLVALDRDEATMAVAREAWEHAGVAHLVDARVGPAMPALDALLLQRGEEGSYDLAFVDADKRAYGDYYERCLRLVRPGGLIVVDNILFYGRVATAERAEGDRAAAALRAFNAALLADERVSTSVLPVGDGMALCWKRP